MDWPCHDHALLTTVWPRFDQVICDYGLTTFCPVERCTAKLPHHSTILSVADDDHGKTMTWLCCIVHPIDDICMKYLFTMIKPCFDYVSYTLLNDSHIVMQNWLTLRSWSEDNMTKGLKLGAWVFQYIIFIELLSYWGTMVRPWFDKGICFSLYARANQSWFQIKSTTVRKWFDHVVRRREGF